MKNYLNRMKGLIARALVAVITVYSVVQPSYAINVPTGPVDLTTLATTNMSLTGASLVKWRQGVANAIPVATSTMTFAYLQSGTNLALPTRTNPADNTANGQNALWSDNAIKVTYTKGNNPNVAVLVYTNNTAVSPDPLSTVALRGGLVVLSTFSVTDLSRQSVLPLFWKAASQTEMQSVSNISTTNPVPSTGTASFLWMPTETSTTCPTGVQEGPYQTPNISRNGFLGFCDFSTKFLTDQTNNTNNPLVDPGTVANSFYTAYAANTTNRLNAFDYSAVISAFGVNDTEGGLGTGHPGVDGSASKPLYMVMGSDLSAALVRTYSTTIIVNLLSE